MGQDGVQSSADLVLVTDLVLPLGPALCKTITADNWPGPPATSQLSVMFILIKNAELLPVPAHNHHRPGIYEPHDRAAVYCTTKPGRIRDSAVNVTAVRQD